MTDTRKPDLGKALPAGARHYRAYVGPPKNYDVVAAMQFNLLAYLGLREHHYLLDVGCGSLRAGRLLIPYLLPDRYFGIEPERWLVDEGIENELGQDILRIKRPTFSDVADFRLTVFGRTFDFIVAHSIFSHASADQIATCLSEGSRALEPGGVLAATYVEGSENYTGNSWVYPGVVAYRLDFIQALAERQDLTCVPVEWPHPANQRWLLLGDSNAAGNLRSLSKSADGAGTREALRLCRERLERLERHPAVRLGRKLSAIGGRWGRRRR